MLASGSVWRYKGAMQKLPLFALSSLLAVGANAADANPPATHKVKTAPFKVEITLQGKFAAQNLHEIQLKPKSWADLKVLRDCLSAAISGGLLVVGEVDTAETMLGMIEGVRQVASLDDPVGHVLEQTTRPNGLEIKKVSVPIGVIGII